jgi:hypothetical protein
LFLYSNGFKDYLEESNKKTRHGGSHLYCCQRERERQRRREGERKRKREYHYYADNVFLQKKNFSDFLQFGYNMCAEPFSFSCLSCLDVL